MRAFLARKVLRLCWLLAALASGFASVAAQTELVVAADGSAKYRTVQEAVMAVPAGGPSSPVVIRVRPGRYKELVYVQREKRFFRLVGEDAARTAIPSSSLSITASLTDGVIVDSCEGALSIGDEYDSGVSTELLGPVRVGGAGGEGAGS